MWGLARKVGPVQKQCELASCGRTFEAQRSTARFCSQAHQKKAKRTEGTGRSAKLVALPSPPAEPEDPTSSDRPLTPIADATKKQLEGAGRLDTPIGVAALAVALRLDLSGLAETGSSYASLLKGYREALAEAMKDAQTAADPVDQIRASAALKLIAGGKQ